MAVLQFMAEDEGIVPIFCEQEGTSVLITHAKLWGAKCIKPAVKWLKYL